MADRDFVSEDSAPTNQDAYAQAPKRSLDLASLPQGLPFLGPLTGYGPEHFSQVIRVTLNGLSKAARRPLTPDEEGAVAYHTARGISYASYGPTLGFIGAGYRIYTTRETFRWPFMGDLRDPKSPQTVQTWNGSQLRFGGREVLSGVSPAAKATCLHILRGMTYSALAVLFMSTVANGYGASVSMTSQLRDPRLATLNKDIRQGLRNSPDLRILQQQMAEHDHRRAEDHNHGPPPQKTFEPDDDASPTGGMAMEYDLAQDTPNETVSSGSSWDRIRSQASANVSTRSPASSVPVADDLEQAQQDFDARVERERQGGEFGR